MVEMATNWSQGGQYGGSRPYGTGSTAQAYERPPTCFNCGEEGHFVVNCPQSMQSAPVGLPVTAQGANVQNSNGPTYGSPAYNVTRYPVPSGAAPGTGVAPGTYAPPGQSPQQYQQYTTPAPQTYSHQSSPPQVPYAPYSQNPSYNGSQSYSQSAQSYGTSTGPPQQQYGYQGNYQAPPQGFNQYSQPSTPQKYTATAYQIPTQPYAQPQAPYQAQPALYQAQSCSYDQNYNYGAPPTLQNQPTPSNWNPTTPQAQPYTAPSYQQPPQAQYNAGYQSQYEQNAIQASYPPQQPQQAYGSSEYEYQPPPQDSGYGFQQNQQAPAYPYSAAPAAQQYFPDHSQQSRASSIASTPYRSRRGSATSSQGGRERSTLNGQNQTTPTQKPAQPPSEEEQQFNWDFKKIFKEDFYQPAVPINRPFPNAFEDDTLSLYANTSTDTVSRYASKNHARDFKQSIKSSYNWPSMQQDPVFSDMRHEAPLIPLEDLAAWTEERHKKHAATVTSFYRPPSESSRKRTWTDEQEDIDNQINQEAFAEYQETAAQAKRQKSGDVPYPVTTVFGDRQGTGNAGPGTPVLGRAGTPSFGVEDDAWAPQAGEGEDPTEARLAALGVSGAPKPVQPMDPVPLPEDFNSYRGYNFPPQRQDSGYVSANGSYSNGPDRNSYKSGYNQSYAPQWQGQPPPPPPPPPQNNTFRRFDGAADTPSPPNDKAQDITLPQASNGIEQIGSPVTPASSETLAPQEPQPRRKIVRVISGKKSEPLRQVDDVTPRFKRSQPVVAEAYSRRW